MKKKLIIAFLLVFSTLGFSQNLLSEYRYLTLIKNQNHQLIEDNIRNAEIVGNELFYTNAKDLRTASLFLMELGANYTIIDKPELALYSFLRQRFCFPYDSLNLAVEKQIRLNAIKLKMDKQMVDYLILKSSAHNISQNKEENINKLIYYSSKFENKELTPILIKQIEFMNSCGLSQSDYLLKWEDLSRIEIPIKYKLDYLEKNFNDLELEQKQRYYKYQLRFYLKHNAWKQADHSLYILDTLDPNKSNGLNILKIRTKWHF